jgi:hypothetical protein
MSIKHPHNIIFMIAGPHSGFSLEHIFSVKKAEESVHGSFFWGYAGTLCHPHKVNAFVQNCLASGMASPKILLAATPSKYTSAVGRLLKYSIDDSAYAPLPQDVVLTGCKYAVVGKNIMEANCEVDLNKYEIATGDKEGKPLGEYIRYRVNKGCARLRKVYANESPRFAKIAYVADMVEPYCVFLR